jgi:hypothetical protein
MFLILGLPKPYVLIRCVLIKKRVYLFFKIPTEAFKREVTNNQYLTNWDISFKFFRKLSPFLIRFVISTQRRMIYFFLVSISSEPFINLRNVRTKNFSSSWVMFHWHGGVLAFFLYHTRRQLSEYYPRSMTCLLYMKI